VPDNVTIPASGTGDATPKVATDQLAGGEHVQYVKLMDGTLDGSTKVAAGAAGLKVDASGAAVPITDNAGSLTVDAPVGTPLWVRLSDGAAAFIGQKAMAASIPVVVASDQSVIPVSDNAGSLTVDAPVATPVFARLSDGAAVLIGQKVMASSLPVALASDQGVLHVDDNSGSLTVDAPVATPIFARLSDGAAALIGQKVMASSLPVAISSDQPALAAPTLTKGTQAATGYSVQELKDAGRVNIMWTAEFTFAQVAETLLTLTESRDGAAVTTFSSKVVTSGKRLRITSMFLEVETLGTGTTVPQRGYLRMRFNTAGAATTASPLQAILAAGAQPPAILKTVGTAFMDFPDGVEFLGDGTKQIGFSLETPDWVVTTQTGRAKVSITAFEY
jgi:hypothetical protein